MIRLFFLLLLTSSLYAHTKTTVESSEAVYDGHIITLTGKVVVTHDMGKIHAEKARLIRDQTGKSTIDFPWVELEEHVLLTLPKGGLLSCHHLFLDHVLLHAKFWGSSPDKQVNYIDTWGEILADHAQIDYRQAEKKVEPTKITLQGNVRMIRNVEEEQWATAEQVEYFPAQEQMIFSGVNERVLFYDKKRDVQLSAYTVIAERDPETKKESVRGLGDVRFVLGQEELAKLKTHFNWE